MTWYVPAAETFLTATAHWTNESVSNALESIRVNPLSGVALCWVPGKPSPHQNATSVAGPVVVTLLLVTGTGTWAWTTSFHCWSWIREPSTTSMVAIVI